MINLSLSIRIRDPLNNDPFAIMPHSNESQSSTHHDTL